MLDLADAEILIGEDDEYYGYLMEHILRRAGSSVRLAANGLEVMELAQRKPPQLILLDWQIPGLDGRECTRRIKQNSQMAHIVILAVTASYMLAERDEILAAGCDGLISKPVSIRTLVSEVKRWLMRKAPR